MMAMMEVMRTPEPVVDLVSGGKCRQARLVRNNRLEILQTMRSLQKHGTLLTAAYMPEHLMLLTRVLDVDDSADHVYLDCSSNQQVNHEIVDAHFIVVTAKLSDEVMIQFFCALIEQVTHQGRQFLRIDLPKYMIKLERRDFHRIHIPDSQAIEYTCATPHSMKGRLVNISLTGARISLPPSHLLEAYPGNLFRSCQMDLPGAGTIQVDLRVVRIVREPSSGQDFKLFAGCRFEGLQPAAESRIERFIMRSQVSRLHG